MLRSAYDPPVNAKLRSDSRYRADTKFMLPTQLLEQIHFGSPVQPGLPIHSGDRRLRDRGWAKSISTTGPNSVSGASGFDQFLISA